jgi:hypothetical protein
MLRQTAPPPQGSSMTTLRCAGACHRGAVVVAVSCWAIIAATDLYRYRAAWRERLGSRLTLYIDGSGDEVLGGGADTLGPASKEIGRGAILVPPLDAAGGSPPNLAAAPIVERRRPPQARKIILHASFALWGSSVSPEGNAR